MEKSFNAEVKDVIIASRLTSMLAFRLQRFVNPSKLEFQLVDQPLTINNQFLVLELNFLTGDSHAQTIFGDCPPGSTATLCSNGSKTRNKIDSRFSQFDQWQTDLRIGT